MVSFAVGANAIGRRHSSRSGDGDSSPGDFYKLSNLLSGPLFPICKMRSLADDPQ